MNEFSNITQQAVHWGNGLGVFFLVLPPFRKGGGGPMVDRAGFVFRISDIKNEEYDKMIYNICIYLQPSLDILDELPC